MDLSNQQRAASSRTSAGRRRNKAFEETHAVLIETAVRLISEKGVAALSLSEVARAADVNRTTVYYHFDSREVLIDAVRNWSSQQLAVAFAPVKSREERTRYIARFVMENPEVIGLWAEDFLAPGNIGDRYPEWNRLVAGLSTDLRSRPETADMDPEAYCTLLLTWAMLGPRVYRGSVRPDLPLDEAVDRMTRTLLDLLRLQGMDTN